LQFCYGKYNNDPLYQVFKKYYKDKYLIRDLCINREDWKNPLFTHLAIFLKLVLAELRLALKKSPSG
jgi:hypothetical protein